MSIITLLIATLLCCCAFGRPYCDAYEFGLSPTSQRYACLFPFSSRNENKTYVDECMQDADKMVCPIYVQVGIPPRKIIREGICKCTKDDICPEIKETSNVAHHHLSYKASEKILTCEWNTKSKINVNPNATERPATIMLFNKLDIAGDLVIFDGPQKKQRLRAVDPNIGTWTREEDMWISLHAQNNPQKSNTFDADIFIGFCSHFDGSINLTSTQTFSPKAPLISSNYNYPIGINYRKQAYCTWLVDLKRSVVSRNHIYSFNFYQFDLGTGDVVLIYEDNSNLGIPNVMHSFDLHNPPYPLYSSARSLRVVFQSDGTDEKLGFNANVFENSCGSNAFNTPIAFTGLSGTIMDGTSRYDNYPPNQNCGWVISHPYPKSTISITFNYYNLHDSDDLAFYEGGNPDFPNLIKRLKGPYDKNELTTITSKGNKIFIYFSTNAQPQDKKRGWGDLTHGFSLNWTVCGELCLTCPAGTHYDTIKQSCHDCPLQTYSTAGSMKCEVCPPGQKWRSTSSCTPCSAGFYGKAGVCEPCPDGHIAPEQGTITCAACMNGTYSANNTCIGCKDRERVNAAANGCEPMPVPMNKESVIIYAVLCSLMLILVVGVLTFLQWRKSQPENRGYSSELQMY